MIDTVTAPHAIEQPTATTANWRRLLSLAVIIAACLALFFGRLGDVPLLNPDEGLYAEPAREMLDTGEYITTLLNYAVRFTKPPLAIWLMALSYKILGVNEFAARFPGALAASLLVVVSYLFLAKFLNRRVAVIAALILASAPMYIGVARMAITDMPLALFTAGALMAFFTAYQTRKSEFSLLGYVLTGLAVMTKGPVGALLPFLIMSAYVLLNGDLRRAIKLFNIPLGLLIIAAIALPWFVVEIYLTKGAYFQEFILRENFQRFTSVVDSHKGGWWYHLAAMFGGFFPWSIFLPQVLALLLRDPLALYRKLKEGKDGSSINRDGNEIRLQIRIFCLCWVLITLVFFSASVSKLLTYTLPAFPALAALVALELEDAWSAGSRLRLVLPFSIIAVSFGLAAGLAGFALERMREAPLGLAHIIASFGFCQAFVSIFVVMLVSIGWRKQAVAIFVAALSICILYFGGQLLPEISKAFEGDVPEYAQQAAGTSSEIIVYDLRKPGIPFYARRKVVQAPDRNNVDEILKRTGDAFIITKTRDLEQFKRSSGFRVIAKDERFAFLRWQSSGLPGPI